MNTKYKEPFDISFTDLFKYIISHIILIASIAIVFVIISLTFSLTTPKKYEIEYIVKLNRLPNENLLSNLAIPHPTPEIIYNEMTTKSSIEKALQQVDPEENMSYKEIQKTLSINYNAAIDYLIFSAKNIENPETYHSLIQKLLENTISHNQLNKGQIKKAISEIENAISYSEKLKYPSENLSTLTLQKSALLNILENNFEYYETIKAPYTKIKENQQLSIIGIIKTFIAGSLLGIIIVGTMYFTDKHIYNSKTLGSLVGAKNVIGILPLFKSQSHDPIMYNMLSNNITQDYENIEITSLSEKSGKKCIAENLKPYLNNTNIRVCKSIRENPADILKRDDSALSIVIIKAGFDEFNDVLNIDNIFKINHKDVKYILNFAEGNDPQIFKTITSPTYAKKNPFISSKHFYKKLIG